MEALRKLERIQKMLSFLEARGLSSDRRDVDRFVAEFLLFLVQPYGNLSMKEQCHLISDFLQKVSPNILEDALYFADREDADCQKIQNEIAYDCYLEKRTGLHLSRSEGLPVIGLDAMIRANSTLEDFCRSYFMFHGMDASKPHEIFKHLPVLSFTESYIYQLDALNEKDLHPLSDVATSLKDRSSHLCSKMQVIGQAAGDNVTQSSGPDPFDALLHLFQCRGLLNDRIKAELKSGVEYWALERKLCHALTSKKKILIEDVTRAVHLKSFDYRVLNLLLYHLRGQQVNEVHMEFLSISEYLVEISDDLYDYEDDVRDNSFNVLRMLVRIYGASTAPSMLAKCITEAEAKYEHLLGALDPALSSSYRRRCEEATKEGGATSGHVFGSWNIPPIIVDEQAFRLRSVNEGSS